VNEYVGGYDDWLRQSLTSSDRDKKQSANKTDTTEAEIGQQPKKSKKLSYKDQRELDALPAKIESFEEEVESIQQLMADENFYKQEKKEIKKVQQQLQAAEASLQHCYDRWEELEAG
jgi:ATP-binding cassette subfamily F protein uup